MSVIEFTNNVAFNVGFSPYVWIGAILVPIFSAVALFRN